MLYFIFGFSFLLSLALSMFKTPSSMAAAIVFLSGALVSGVATSSSHWFSYVLFLVYVGGLLVMFIYVCLVSSNFPFKTDVSRVVLTLGGSLTLLFSVSSPELKCITGGSAWASGSDLLESTSLSLFLSLAILLLVMLLVVVRSSGTGTVKIDT